MTRRERDLVRRAELAALGVPDAAELLSAVVAELRSMVTDGSVNRADAVLSAMLPSTARLLTLCALGDLDRQEGREDSGSNGIVVDLLTRMENDYSRTLDREDMRLDLARDTSKKISAEAGERLAARQRDRTFLDKLHARRRGR